MLANQVRLEMAKYTRGVNYQVIANALWKERDYTSVAPNSFLTEDDPSLGSRAKFSPYLPMTMSTSTKDKNKGYYILRIS